MRLLAAAIILITPLTAAWSADDDHDDHLSELGGVRVLHAWTRATDADHAEVFMDIENTGDAELSLISAETDIADEVHILAIDHAAGGKAVDIDALPISAASETILAPDGVFLELHGLDKSLAKGDEFEMHLHLDPLGEIEVHVQVEAANAANHSHAGHSH